LSATEALRYMQQAGFQLAGQDFRVMGMQELMQLLRKQLRQAAQQHHLRDSPSELQERLDELLSQEEEAVMEQHGFESAKLNDFLGRRHGPSSRLSETIERFTDYEFEDADAAAAYEEL